MFYPEFEDEEQLPQTSNSQIPKDYGKDKSIQFIQQTQTYKKTDDQGISYEYDPDKSAWFPMVSPYWFPL